MQHLIRRSVQPARSLATHTHTTITKISAVDQLCRRATFNKVQLVAISHQFHTSTMSSAQTKPVYKSHMRSVSEDVKKSSIEVLQPLLASALDLKTQVKQAHWNVKGPSFIALHELFGKLLLLQ